MGFEIRLGHRHISSNSSYTIAIMHKQMTKKYIEKTGVKSILWNRNISQKRYLNQDTNAAGVWDPFPEKSAETALDDDNDSSKKKKNKSSGGSQKRVWLSPRVMDAVLTTVMGLAAVGLGGLGNTIYLWGRREQEKHNRCLLQWKKIKHYGVVFADAHSDSEIFKTRLGKALRYTYREDYVGQLFAREAPERGSALLDVEKALNMVEAVAIKYKKRRGRPLVLIINNIHSFKEDEEGEDLMELLQQRAETWAAAKIVTMVFNTDDYTVYERMKRDASRMEVIRINDLETKEAIKLLKEFRNGDDPDEVLEKIITERIGGRLSFVSKLGKSSDLIKSTEALEIEEKHWITSRIGLIPDFEESAFDDQKYALCAWKLIKALVKSQEKSLPLKDCRIITGNPKWIEMMDHDNIIMIDDQQNVKADSKILQNIFEETVNEEGFDELLDNVNERVEEVDKEQRTRELIWSKKNNQVVRHAPPKGWFW
ncbi:10543_t:CDS:2 [Acaulospora colombiana]|uniref:10543_t:CDS:1 n=1 Tax=Acaulospora colombiana TaxID=27376 RepID=A0ACA9N8F6_9GLOM|nr:10543_t:CDS:2 [Acaulospora colombiana]